MTLLQLSTNVGSVGFFSVAFSSETDMFFCDTELGCVHWYKPGQMLGLPKHDGQVFTTVKKSVS